MPILSNVLIGSRRSHLLRTILISVSVADPATSRPAVSPAGTQAGTIVREFRKRCICRKWRQQSGQDHFRRISVKIMGIGTDEFPRCQPSKTATF